MHKRTRRMLSLALVVAMLFSTLSTAFATDQPDLSEPSIITEEESLDSQPSDTTETDSSEPPPTAEEIPEESAEPTNPADNITETPEIPDISDIPAVAPDAIPAGVWSDADPYFTDETPAIPEASTFGLRRAPAARAVCPTYAEAYATLMSLQDEYYEGRKWTNFEPYGSQGSLGPYYTFRGGAIKGARLGVGCAALVFEYSDHVFGTLPARVLDNDGSFVYEDIKVGDFLRVNSNHFVIVLQVSSGGIIVAEGNYNGSVHWGRAISRDTIMDTANFLVTRYPEDYSEESDPDEVVDQGDEGNLHWTLTAGGELTISSASDQTVAMPNFTEEKLPSWADVQYNAVTISNNVSSIGNYAFSGSKALAISIPDSVTSIGNYAFQKSALTAVSIPANVASVGDYAFATCANLTSITISEGVKVVGQHAFDGCTELGYVDFPSSLTKLGAGAFSSCENLAQVRFMPSSGTLELGDGVFVSCWRLQLVSMPEGITALPASFFSSCKTIKFLYLPKTITSLGTIDADPFVSSYVGTVYFGGTESQWQTMINAVKSSPYLMQTTYAALGSAIVQYEQSDPFVPIPDDPGDITFYPCADGHVGEEDVDGNCTVCGEPFKQSPVDPVEPVDPIDPVDPVDPTDPTDPTEPTDPSEPEDPKDPTNPEDPKDPEQPTDPEDPSDPTDPSEPEGPSDSNEPSQPENPGGNDQPTELPPTTPGNPSGSSGGNWNRPSGGNSNNGGGSNTTKPTDTTTPPSDTTTLPENSMPELKTETVRNPDGSTATITTRPDGVMTIDTGKTTPVKVAIPATAPTSGTVAMIVKADGSTEIIRTSVASGNNLIAELSNGATVKLVDNSKTFTDVLSSNWASDAIAFTSARELFAGTTANTFSPNTPMTRAMLMTVLARLDGVDTADGDTWYAKGMDWAKAQGISDGSNPNANITREQLVTMLWRYAGSPAVTGNLASFTDAAQVSGYANDAVCWAVENGIVNGFEDGSLQPAGQATRAQVAQFLQNFITYLTLGSAK